ncbi:MAG: signal peptidase I [Candidatus Acidiferrales bacterium]
MTEETNPNPEAMSSQSELTEAKSPEVKPTEVKPAEVVPAVQANSSFPRELKGWIRDLAVALTLAMVIIVFLYQPVKVEGTSMSPLLSDQERIFINKFVYRFEPIERGDVIVFWYPLDHSKSFIKRVIGLPGESIELRRGRLFINGKEITEDYVPQMFFDGSSYGPMRIPQGSYFVMGDHRDSSNDSRMFGTVPREFIYGKAVFAYWPVDHFGSIPAVEASAK